MLLIEICENIDPEILQEIQLSKTVKGMIAGILIGSAGVGAGQMMTGGDAGVEQQRTTQTQKSSFNMKPAGDGSFQVQDSEIGNFNITQPEWSKIWTQSKKDVANIERQIEQQNPGMNSRGISARVDAAEREARIAYVRELGRQKVQQQQTQRPAQQQSKAQQPFQSSGIASQGQEGDVESF